MYAKERGPMVAKIDYDIYKEKAALLRKRLPPHMFFYIERVSDKEGKKFAKLYCRYPETAKKIIKEVLGD